jgi:hypothetical protein
MSAGPSLTTAPDFYRVRYTVRGVQDDPTREQRFAKHADAFRAYHATAPAPGDWVFLEACWKSTPVGVISAQELSSRQG